MSTWKQLSGIDLPAHLSSNARGVMAGFNGGVTALAEGTLQNSADERHFDESQAYNISKTQQCRQEGIS